MPCWHSKHPWFHPSLLARVSKSWPPIRPALKVLHVLPGPLLPPDWRDMLPFMPMFVLFWLSIVRSVVVVIERLKRFVYVLLMLGGSIAIGLMMKKERKGGIGELKYGGSEFEDWCVQAERACE